MIPGKARILLFKNKPERDAIVPKVCFGSSTAMPVDIALVCCGGISTASAEKRSRPADPPVEKIGSIASI